ncbi:MAG: aminotransferase class V-fold PLP-dependent enzyme [Ginsengibacter sp.]
MSTYKILDIAKEYADKYLDELPGRKVFPGEEALKQLDSLSIPLPEQPTSPEKIMRVLNTTGSPATVASNGGRYFGFVFGGTFPVALAANWLATTWDQNAVFSISSPIAAHIEKVTGQWLLDLLHLPKTSAVGFVTGTTMANFCGLLAARESIFKREGWDVKLRGMNGAPPVKIIVGEEVHASMLRALILAGFGTADLIKIPTDDEGRIIAEKLPELDNSCLVCVQAGNVNTGSIDPIKDICLQANKKGAWVHVDGAFGLWAAASPEKYSMIQGIEMADSWAIDLHKWLNVPYDSGLIICKDPKVLQVALSVSAAYLPDAAEPEPYFYTPEMSRKARGIDAWATIYSLGRHGVAELIGRCCMYAERFAANLENAGFEILNKVTLNQVLVSFGDAAVTSRVIKKIQEDGTCWCGGTVWKGRTAMRISVSSWMTTEEDVELCSAAMIRIANDEIAMQ